MASAMPKAPGETSFCCRHFAAAGAAAKWHREKPSARTAARLEPCPHAKTFHRSLQHSIGTVPVETVAICWGSANTGTSTFGPCSFTVPGLWFAPRAPNRGLAMPGSRPSRSNAAPTAPSWRSLTRMRAFSGCCWRKESPIESLSRRALRFTVAKGIKTTATQVEPTNTKPDFYRGLKGPTTG